jgi:hypothetical protein
MLRRQFTVVAGLILLLGAGAAGAQDVPCVSIAGPEVTKRTERVMKSYQWADSLDALKERAEKEKKLIFWLQLVGELDGGL